MTRQRFFGTFLFRQYAEKNPLSFTFLSKNKKNSGKIVNNFRVLKISANFYNIFRKGGSDTMSKKEKKNVWRNKNSVLL